MKSGRFGGVATPPRKPFIHLYAMAIYALLKGTKSEDSQ
jgi:hypothetical protein